MATASRCGNLLWRCASAHKLMFNGQNISSRFCKQRLQCTTRLTPLNRTCGTFTDERDNGHSDFEKLVRQRRGQVRRSILVHVYSKAVMTNLYNYCSKYGNIAEAFYYSLPNAKDFVLLEFESEQSVDALLGETKHFASHNVIPVHSRCLWYHDTGEASGSECVGGDDSCPAPMRTDALPDDAAISARLQEANSLSDQMIALHEALRLTDLQQRLRFFACLQLESAFSSLFTNCTVLPFGSSINGFGKNNCDLDMVMSLGEDQSSETSPPHLKLFYHTKRSLANNRVQTQRHLESISDVINSFFPGCGSVHRILQARVPIIKFHHELLDTECDLTMSNLSGVYMSELLFLYGELDPRVRPLVTAVLKWAKESALTQISPGRWITNFSLILMVLFFLQARAKPLLPSLGALQQLAGMSDRRTSEGIDCSFVRNLARFPVMTGDSSVELGDLLLEFFTYYSQFDFKRLGISLVSGTTVPKSDFEPLYIQNPLELELNVSKNVNPDELQRIQERMKVTLTSLSTSQEPNNGRDGVWGLLHLMDKILVRKRQKKTAVSAFYPANAGAISSTPATTAFSLSNRQGPVSSKTASPGPGTSGSKGQPLASQGQTRVKKLMTNFPTRQRRNNQRQAPTTDSPWIF